VNLSDQTFRLRFGFVEESFPYIPLPIPSASISCAIRNRIFAPPKLLVLAPHDFAHLGPRNAVDQALHRLVVSKELRRIARRFYRSPAANRDTGKPSPPDPRDGIDALARK
jgi:hypothetical protein